MQGRHNGTHAALIGWHGGEDDALRKTPSWKSRLLNFMANAPSPTITGVMGVSLLPVLKPSCSRPLLKKAVFSQRRSTRLVSSSRISSAAIQVATTEGGCEVLNRTGRARCSKKSRISWLQAT